MVKIFQGDYVSVERDMNSWMEVYDPEIVDMRQSVVLMQKEHDIVLVVTVLYQSKKASDKVQYQMFNKNE